MGKTGRLKLIGIRVFENCSANSFSKLIPASYNFKNNSQETYLFVSDLLFCHLHVISLLTLRSIAIEGDWQN